MIVAILTDCQKEKKTMMQNTQAAMDRRSISLLTLGHVCIDICQGAVPAFLPFLIVERHLSYTAAAGLVLAANLVSSVVQPLFGQLADHHPAPWLLPAGLLVGGTGLALAGLAPTYWLIALAIALSGIGVAAFHPAAARLMNTAAGSKRATGMSIFSIGGTIGFALGPLLTTALLLAFGLGGATLLIVPEVAISIVLINFFPRFLSLQKGGIQRKDTECTTQVDAWGPFALLTAAIVGRSIIFYGLNTFLPLYWIVVLHQSKAAGGFALTVMLLAGAIGTLIGGRMADLYGRRIVVITALSLLTPLMLIFVMFSTVNTVLALLLLIPIGAALFAPFSVMVVMGQEYLPSRVGTASGVTLGLAVTVGGISAPLFGRVADLYGIHTALFGLALVPVLATAVAVALPRPRALVLQQKQA